MTLILAAVLTGMPVLLQEGKPKTAEDLDRRTREILEKDVTLVGRMALPMVLFMSDTDHEANLECFADPSAIPDPNKALVNFTGTAPLDEALLTGLKESKLVHFVWQGVLIITNEEGREGFKEAAWLGFTPKDLKAQEELSKKLMTPGEFKWSAAKPEETLAEFSKKAGVAIDTSALKGVELKKEKRGMLTPSSTTLWGALAFFSRTTGVRFEITKEGWLRAKPPAKTADSR